MASCGAVPDMAAGAEALTQVMAEALAGVPAGGSAAPRGSPIAAPSPPVTTMVATQRDITALHALIEGAYRGDSARGGWTHEADLLSGQRTDPAALGDIIADTRKRLLFGRDDTGLLGCVALADKGAGLAYLGMLTVAPDRQGTGLGRQLIAAAEQTARTQLGARTMEMTVIAQRPELIAWYQRCGYALTGEERPFPYGDERFGIPQAGDLRFVVLARAIA